MKHWKLSTYILLVVSLFLWVSYFSIANGQEWQEARMSLPTLSGTVAAGGASCNATPFYDSSGGTFGDWWGVSSLADGPPSTKRYVGFFWTNAVATKSICKIEFEMNTQAGDLDGKTLYLEIWSIEDYATTLPANPITDGTTTVVCAANSCDSWSSTYVAWTWSGSYPSVINAGTYAITLSMHADDETNYASLNTRQQTNDLTNLIDRWRSDKVNNFYSATERPRIKMYAYE